LIFLKPFFLKTEIPNRKGKEGQVRGQGGEGKRIKEGELEQSLIYVLWK
jgi:hypothetical protein